MTREQFRELVGIAIGEASMCWTEAPGGVFDSTKALKLVERIVEEFPPTDEEVQEMSYAASRKLGW